MSLGARLMRLCQRYSWSFITFISTTIEPLHTQKANMHTMVAQHSQVQTVNYLPPASLNKASDIIISVQLAC